MSNYKEIDWFKHQEVLEKYIDEEILQLDRSKGQFGSRIHHIMVLSKLTSNISVDSAMFEGGLDPETLDIQYTYLGGS